MRGILLGLALLMVGMALAAAPPAVDPQQRAAVAQILDTIKAGDDTTTAAAEDALAALGEAALPALQAAFTDERAALSAAEKDPDKLGQTLLMQQWARALDGAVIRLSWKLNPRQLIKEWMSKLKDFDGQPFAVPATPARALEAPVGRVFPDYLIYSVRFRTYPVARALPEPLTANNLFVIDRKGNVLHLTDAAGMETFFKAALKPKSAAQPVSREQVQDDVYAWLVLSEQFADPFFRFTIAADAITVLPGNATTFGRGAAQVIPQGGNSGEIKVELAINLDGSLREAQETRTLKTGMRPICQATKLLDADPIVRGMAEQDLMMMGRTAEAYLVQRRAEASPELQAAIDRIWARIIAEER